MFASCGSSSSGDCFASMEILAAVMSLLSTCPRAQEVQNDQPGPLMLLPRWNPLSSTVAGAALISGVAWLFSAHVSAQAMPSRGSLGGYGGSTLDMGAAANQPAGVSVLPYSGGYAGFMPYRMSRGGELGLQPRTGRFMGESRSGLTLAPMSSPTGMSRSGGMGDALSRPLIGTAGSTMLPGSSFRGSPRMGSGVMPPNLGYPFRSPSPLLRPARSGSGMSM